DDQKNQIPIEELQLSVRAYNCLKRAQVNTVADLLVYSEEDLLEIKNFGQKSAEEVVEALQVHLGIMLPLEKPAKSV
ncbi:MAG: DNA-directed RNA polymerase subunit alpha C-terminal domain-containing protein, partial [Cyanobacteria bacterium J06635_11]